MDVPGLRARSPKGRTWIWGALAWLVAWAFSLSVYAITDDHFDRLSRARQIARHGELPFADFFDPGYFLGELTSAGLQRALGDSFLGEALLTSSFIAAGSVIVFFLARRLTTPAWATAVAVAAMLVLPRQYDYDKVAFFPLGLVLCWRYVERQRVTDLLWLAIGIAVAALFRYDTGVYIGLSSLVAIAIAHAGDWRVLARRAALLVGTALLAVSPFLVFVQAHGGLSTAIDQVFTYGMREGERTRVRSLPGFSIRPTPPRSVIVRWAPPVSDADRRAAEARHGLHDGEPRANGGDRTWAYHLGDGSTQALRALVNDPSIEDTGRIDRSRLRVEEPLSMRAWHALPTPWQWLPGLLHAANGQAWLYYMFRLLPLIAVAVLAAGLVGGTLPSRAMVARVASLVTFCLLLNLFIMREPVTARFGAMAGPAAVLSLWLSLQAWQVGVGGRRLAARAMTVLLATVTVWAISVSSSWRELLTARLLDPSHLTTTLARMASSPPSDELLPTGRRAGLVRYLRECTEPTDRVLVAWFAPEVYFFAQRPFAAHMVVFFGQHWSEPRFADLSARNLSTQGAAIVVRRTGDEGFGETYSALARVLEERFELAGTTSFGDPEMPDDGYTVLVPRGRRATRKDGEFQLPCFR